MVVLLVIAQFFVGVRAQLAEKVMEKCIWLSIGLAVVVLSAFAQFWLLYDHAGCQ